MPQIPVAHGGVGFGQTFATTTYGTTLTAGSANVQGTIVELIAATAYDAHWVEVMASALGSQATSYAVDILIGAATEELLIPKLHFSGRAFNEGGGRWLFPVFVPAGSRLAASVQASTGSVTALVAVNLFNAGIAAGGLPTRAVQYGTLTSSRGVNVDPGAMPNTDAAWAEITAATEVDHNWIVLTVSNTDFALGAATKVLIDVGIGADTEQVLVPDLSLSSGATFDSPRPDQVFHLPVFVPKGSRLTVRHRCSVGDDGDRDLMVTLHGC